MAKDHADFERFKAEYDRLAETPREKEMGSQVGRLYQEYKSLGDGLMAKKDAEEVLFARITANFGKSDDILDEQIQANLDESGPHGIEKVRQAAEMEVNIAEVGTGWAITFGLPRLSTKSASRITSTTSGGILRHSSGCGRPRRKKSG